MAACTTTCTVRRTGQIAFAYLTACLVAGLVAGAASTIVLGPFAIIVAVAVWIGATVLALVPSAIVIVYAERHGVRSAEAHYAFGAGIGLVTAGVYVVGDALFAWGSLLSAAGLLIIALCTVAGAVAGATYHAMAGHSAGE